MAVTISAVIAAVPVPVLMIDGQERIVALNPPAQALFGIDGTGRHYITVLRQPAVLDIIEQTLRDGAFRQARYLGAEGGRDTTWRVTAAGVEADGGHLMLVSFEDLTALEEAGQMRRDFVANVSHELRTPLTALLGFIETLNGAAREDSVARERFLAIMKHEAARMARLVDDLLSLSRVEAEERMRPLVPVDLPGVLEQVITSFEPLAREAGVKLTRRIAPDLPEVPGDAGQLRQVVNNLIENAIKYGGTGGTVEIELTGPSPEPSLRGDGIRLVVTDHGDGIAAHHIPRLTERFYRIDSHRSREVGGTGLGLAIVKHIVNRHRGRLRIESEAGQGSRFSVILPV
ncbi:MAG: PAS domain-containing protein [Rubellimicrobium sp.]|nr:PAS domain-containing protein [Rubellimicrobium sp.]